VIGVTAGVGRIGPPRRRFTIGHELGHWVLHQQGQTTIFCRHGQIEEEAGEDRPPLDPIEEEANQFAAALLMPAELLRREYERDRDFDRLCAAFGSSRAAMGKRLHQVI
jgi:Zn-dependent peptidase ImmA (M78 family)